MIPALGELFWLSAQAWVSSSLVRTEAEAAEGMRATRLRAVYNTDKAPPRTPSLAAPSRAAADSCAAQAANAADQINSMNDLRSSVDAAEAGEAYAYMYPFLFFEQYKIIVREAILNLSLALVAVTIITALMLFDVRATALVSTPPLRRGGERATDALRTARRWCSTC